jgi:hypothetical protein
MIPLLILLSRGVSGKRIKGGLKSPSAGQKNSRMASFRASQQRKYLGNFERKWDEDA